MTSRRAAADQSVRVRHLAGAAALLVTIVAAVVGLIGVSRRPPATLHGAPPAQVPTAARVLEPPLVRHAIAWTVRNVPRSASVLADRAVGRVLRRRGYVDVLPVDFGPRDGMPTFAIASPALRAAAVDNVRVRRALAGSAPVARFGSGAHAIVIRRRVGGGAGAVARARAADLRARRRVEQRLLANRALTAAPAVRRLLRDGSVDMRCATALGLLARRGPVRLLAVRVDPAERAAGLPARVVVIRAHAADATAVLGMLSLPYHPASVRQLPDGAQRWTWPVRAVPVGGRG